MKKDKLLVILFVSAVSILPVVLIASMALCKLKSMGLAH